MAVGEPRGTPNSPLPAPAWEFVFARKQGQPCQGFVKDFAVTAASGEGQRGHSLGGGWEQSPSHGRRQERDVLGQAGCKPTELGRGLGARRSWDVERGTRGWLRLAPTGSGLRFRGSCWANAGAGGSSRDARCAGVSGPGGCSRPARGNAAGRDTLLMESSWDCLINRGNGAVEH